MVCAPRAGGRSYSGLLVMALRPAGAVRREIRHPVGVPDDRHLCLVCGYPNLKEPPWRHDSASDEICPSCGTHYGYDDFAGGDAAARDEVYRRLRAEWIGGGMVWWSSREQPRDWNPRDQVRSVAG